MFVRRNAAEVTEFNRNGFIRRGELRSTAGRAGADLRRRAIQSRWDARKSARKERSANGFVRRGEFRSRASDPAAYGKRREVKRRVSRCGLECFDSFRRSLCLLSVLVVSLPARAPPPLHSELRR